MSFTADHIGFYLSGEPFYPDESNVAILSLSACLKDDLNWANQLEHAKNEAKFILWDIDLGLPHHVPRDSAVFLSLGLAVEEFGKNVWPQFKDKTFGVVLYRGIIDPRAFQEFSEGDCTEILAEYLHRLVSFLPDDTLAFAMLDLTGIPQVQQVQCILQFEHCHLILKGAKHGLKWEEGRLTSIQTRPAPLAVYWPSNPDASVLELLGELLSHLKETHFRIIPEEKLTEQWNELDTLIVPHEAVTAQGKRKLLGFNAAGGTVLDLLDFLQAAK
jgi:hypothetical protein